MAPTDELLDREKECALHQRLLARDSAATADLLAAFLEPLIGLMIASNRGVDEHLCIEAAEDALLGMVKKPSSYDPARSKSLFGYLCMSASRDLQNLLEKWRRHSSKRIPIDSVELSPADGNSLGRDDGALLRLEVQEEVVLAEPIVNAIKQGLPPEELTGLELYLEGEKKTEAFAVALGIQDRPFDEQQDTVKRFRDKIVSRIKRARRDHEPS